MKNILFFCAVSFGRPGRGRSRGPMNFPRSIGLLLLAWLAPWQTTHALTVSPSPSTNGSYTVSWSPSTNASRPYTRLLEQFDDGAWREVGRYGATVRSKSLSGREAGRYRYKTNHCSRSGSSGARFFGSLFSSIPKILVAISSCHDAAGPVSMDVQILTVSLRWDPATVEYEANSTLRWEATQAHSCARWTGRR